MHIWGVSKEEKNHSKFFLEVKHLMREQSYTSI